MDAVEFLKERSRMCKAQGGCSVCPIDAMCYDYFVDNNYSQEKINGMVTIVEQWAKDNPAKPVKTRQSEFLKMFPNAKMYTGNTIEISPCILDVQLREDCNGDCIRCLRDYWLQEVE